MTGSLYLVGDVLATLGWDPEDEGGSGGGGDDDAPGDDTLERALGDLALSRICGPDL